MKDKEKETERKRILKLIDEFMDEHKYYRRNLPTIITILPHELAELKHKIEGGVGYF